MRINLQRLSAIALVIGVLVVVTRSAGLWTAIGTATAIIAMAWAILSAKRGPRWIVRSLVCTLALTAIWFLAVDWSWFVEDCPDCMTSRDIGVYRVFGIPISTTTDYYRTVFDLTLADLGVPCTHKDADRWHKHRWWGLVVCRCPCINGIDGLIGNDEIPQRVISATMQELARGDPTFAVTLHDRVVDDHDYEFFWRAFKRASTENRSGTQGPRDSP
jgi:hypothetical protein